MLQHNIDPKYSQFFLDTCAFDPKYTPEDCAANELWSRYEAEKVSLLLAHSNQREIDHPNTPKWVKNKALSMVFTVEVQLNSEELSRLVKLEQLLRGNAQSERHKDDARHLFEASKYGGYFVTTDHRILKMADEIFQQCRVQVLKPSGLIHRLDLGDGAYASLPHC